MSSLREHPDDLLALCGAAADAFGIPDPAFVEKDFWVVEVLRSVVAPLDLEPVDTKSCSARVMFKGGTSLSKAYRLTDRFSEDVDILVVIEGYGAAARDNRVLRPICERSALDLGFGSDQVAWLNHKTGSTRNVDYSYPRRIPTETIRPTLRLEMGIRGGVLPGTRVCTVTSWVADLLAQRGDKADFDELAPVDVETIAPVRTLVEKLALLHHAGVLARAGGDERSLREAGRHFYDVYRLLSDSTLAGELSADTGMVATLAVDVDEHSARYDWGYTARPVDGYGASVVFDPRGPVRDIAEIAYEEGLRLVWGLSAQVRRLPDDHRVIWSAPLAVLVEPGPKLP